MYRKKETDIEREREGEMILIQLLHWGKYNIK